VPCSARAEDAVGAALEAQRALGSADFTAIDGLRVRMALHTGTADERDSDRRQSLPSSSSQKRSSTMRSGSIKRRT
jgi:hypothetical protein